MENWPKKSGGNGKSLFLWERGKRETPKIDREMGVRKKYYIVGRRKQGIGVRAQSPLISYSVYWRQKTHKEKEKNELPIFFLLSQVGLRQIDVELLSQLWTLSEKMQQVKQ